MALATLLLAGCADRPVLPVTAATPTRLSPPRTKSMEVQVPIDPVADESSSRLGNPAEMAVIRLTLANLASSLGE